MGNDIFDTIMTACTAFLADTQLTYIQTDIIIYNNDMLWVHFIEICRFSYALTA